MKLHAIFSTGILLLSLAITGCEINDRKDLPSATRGGKKNPVARDTSGQAINFPRGKGSVYFRLKEITDVPDTIGMRSWLGVYEAEGKTARFQLDLKLPRHHDNSGRFSSARGTLYRVSNSDPSILLGDIAKALKANAPPKPKKRLDSLTLPMVVLGTGMSRANDSNGGHLASEPEGNWIATKVFVADGDAEFYLNLNLIDGWGEISIKDENYGDAVVGELAEVL
ncbi:MAG: hypothetical protein ABIR47_10540 [Candidatus Kapaibacterium sp.]